MNVTEALGWATTALETRARQWRDAANGVFDDSELHDADIDERNNMADKYEEALETLMTFGIVAIEVDDQGNTRMVNIKGNIRATFEATSAQHPLDKHGVKIGKIEANPG